MIQRRTAVAADAANLPALTRFIHEFWSAAALPVDQALAFELALEEVFVNVATHAAPAQTVASVEVSLAIDDDRITMTVEDDGPQFDPLALPPPDVTSQLEERPVGGLGVFLVRKMMEAVRYRRVGGRNQLWMMKHIAP